MTIGIRDQTFSSEDMLMALFARMDSVAMSIALAISLALGLAIATAVLLLTATPGVPVGPNLAALGNVLPGYSVTWLGCVIGAAWAALIGAILGFLIAACWNFTHVVLVGLVALLYQPSHSAPRRGSGGIVT